MSAAHAVTAPGALAGRDVVVVGGGSGIGQAVALQAVAAGARVTVMDIDPEALARTAGRLPGSVTVPVDVLDEDAVAAAFAALEAVDHVYVSAGTTQLGSILDGDVDGQLGPLRLRLHGAINVVRAAVPKLPAGGSITLTGGVSTDRPVPGAWVSSVGTAAAEQLARALALDLAPVRFNAVAPGFTDTPMWDAVLGDDKPAVFAQATAGQLTGRLGTADEVAAAVLFLMGNGSVTGEVIHVDGGARLT